MNFKRLRNVILNIITIEHFDIKSCTYGYFQSHFSTVTSNVVSTTKLAVFIKNFGLFKSVCCKKPAISYGRHGYLQTKILYILPYHYIITRLFVHTTASLK